MDRKPDSDNEEALSDYSSCEGSEFERYCSANSAFGSASWCSSNHSELPDSFRTHKENRRIREKFWRSRWNYASDEGVESPRTDSLPRIRSGSKLDFNSNGNCSVPDGNSGTCENLGGGVNGFGSDQPLLEEGGDGLSGGGECSEGEDSMRSYGSDDERRNHMCGTSKRSAPKKENENPLLIDSSVAFGSDDWDEFIQENGGNGFTMLTMHQDFSLEHQLGHLDCVNVQEQDDGGIQPASSRAEDINLYSENFINGPVRNTLLDGEVTKAEKLITKTSMREGYLDLENDGLRRKMQCLNTIGSLEDHVFGEQDLQQTLLSESPALQFHSTLDEAIQDEEIGTTEFGGVRSSLQVVEDSSLRRDIEGNSNSTDVIEKDIVPSEVKKLDPRDSYDDMVLEMEEILLDSGKSYGARITQANQGYTAQQSRQFRDGSSTASTSGTDDAYPLVHHAPKIDWIEVVGAKQKKGDVSFGERLVGVKEFTEYQLRVWSGKDQWEVERRYRDFYALYRQLKILFTDYGLSLPSPWSNVEHESRKIFGNASPIVVGERSTLIQNCLRSVLNFKYPLGTQNSLVCFLSPSKSMHGSGLLEALIPRGDDEKSKVSNSEEVSQEDMSMYGKTISLVVEIKLHKSMRQLLEAQFYRCAGCHRQLDAGKTLLREIVQTLGWNKPRLCEYTGQLFCASCHTNDTAVLPARVLNLWDFTLYPVSQLAKAYLESIHDQPMLCVSAVNPFLFSKVPALLQVVSMRKKIGAMLPCIRCPFRRSIQRGLGIRRHLLESNDFFALRDLVDLSKGAFAALPAMLETISSKILEHITQQCLECYDSGIPCAARGACQDPSSLVFPFQESEAIKCGSCGSILHEPCFSNLMGCPCGKPTNVSQEASLHGLKEPPASSSTSGFFSDILSKARPDKIWKPKDRSPVILMGSLPRNTSL